MAMALSQATTAAACDGKQYARIEYQEAVFKGRRLDHYSFMDVQ